MPTKTGKKNFKDFTGTKFSDLIMPLVLGGVGSISRPAGRGVGLGLEAFRTFKAGQALSDEKQAGQDMSDLLSGFVDDLKDKRTALTEETARKGIYQEEGPTFTDVQEQIIGDRAGSGEASLDQAFNEAHGIDADQITPDQERGRLAFEQSLGGGVEEPQLDQDQIAGRSAFDESFSPDYQEPQATEAEDYSQAIIGVREKNQDAQKQLGFIDGQIRFMQIAAQLGVTNPNSAGYMAGMNNMQQSKQEALKDYQMQVRMDGDHSRADKSRYALMEMARKRGDAEYNRMRDKEVENDKILQFGADGGTYVVFTNEGKRETITVNGTKVTPGEMGAALTFEERSAQYKQSFDIYQKMSQMVRDGMLDQGGEDFLNAQKNFRNWALAMQPGDEDKWALTYGTKFPELGGTGEAPLDPEEIIKRVQSKFDMNRQP